ncbi:MAG: FecR domain-containing protein [Pseudomonadota bacterium]|nr:MAG: hypothetical protein DIU78_17450 [Pseudomonadota bacterium]
MSDRAHYTQMLRDRVRPTWNAEREERVRNRIERALDAQKRKGRATVVALVSLAAAVALTLGLSREPLETASAPAPAATTTNAAPSGVLRLTDGSEVTLLSNDARVEALPESSSSVAMRLAAGKARFSVTSRPDREFSVIAGHVRITVLGTLFTVTVEGDSVHVAVERGRVRVSSARGDQELGRGETARFTRDPPSAVAPPPTAAALPEPSDPAPRPAPRSWRTLAESGDYEGALDRLVAEGPNAVRDTPDELLLAADVARLGGQPERAVAPLERLLRRHPNDARAPLAAFTLGRTLLDQLGRPREAARAFRTAQELDTQGALAEDALAREVESWARAGETALARKRAAEFLARYPDGRRAAAVRRLSGVE